jgi:hypothetical protein
VGRFDSAMTILSRAARDSRRTAASQSHALTHAGSKFVHSTEIIRLQFRVVVKDLRFRHTRSEPGEHIPHSNPQPANTRWPERLPGSIVMREVILRTYHWLSNRVLSASLHGL